MHTYNVSIPCSVAFIRVSYHALLQLSRNGVIPCVRRLTVISLTVIMRRYRHIYKIS